MKKDPPKIIKINYAKAENIPGLVKLHLQLLNEGLAAALGKDFLAVLYQRLIEQKLGLCLAASKNQQVAGLCVGLIPGAVWQLGWGEIKRGNWHFTLTLTKNLVSHPRFLFQFIKGRKKQPKYIELYFLAVTKQSQNQGIGTKLIRQFDKELKKRGEKGYFLITWSGGKAEKFYFKTGFSKIEEAAYLGQQISFLWKDLK